VPKLPVRKTKVTELPTINTVETSLRLFTCTTQKPKSLYEGWNFNSDNYLFTTDTK